MLQQAQKKLDGDVQINERLVGGYSESNTGRSLAAKSAVLVAVEEVGGGRSGNMGMEAIENFRAAIMEPGVDKMAAAGASLKTDSHKSYVKMRKDGKNIETGLSDNGELLQKLHR